MPFIQTVGAMLASGTFTFTLILFLVSLLLLVVGMTSKVWTDVLNLRSLESRPLNWIEHTHPHVPSARIVLTLNICVVTLLAVGLQTLRGTFPFNDPYQGLNLVTLFVLAAAMGTLAEIRWKGTSRYAYAFVLGTAIAFLSLTFLSALPSTTLLEKLLLGTLTLAAAAIAWRTQEREENATVSMRLTIGVFLFWIVIYAVR